MKNISEKKLQLILLFWLTIPLSIMTFLFFLYIKYSTESQLSDTLSRFNENTSIDSVDIPVSEIQKTLISISELLSEDEDIDKFLSHESSTIFQQIAYTIQTNFYLDNIIVVKKNTGNYKIYPERVFLMKILTLSKDHGIF